jgi:hypothetical protein
MCSLLIRGLAIGLILVQPALAVPVAWTMHGVTLSNGGTVTGTFVYDADANLYSDVSIDVNSDILLNGSVADDPAMFLHYDDVSNWPVAWDSSTISMTNQWEGEYNGDAAIESTYQTFSFAQQLTNAGGVISIASGWGELQHVLNFGSGSGYTYTVTGGNVSAVPIPAAVWLFGSALAGLGYLRKRIAVQA